MIISDKIYIPISKLKNKVNDLAKLFTYQNPEFFEKGRMGFSTANCSPFLVHYMLKDVDGEKMLVLPRGGFNKVKEFFKKHDIAMRFIDETVLSTSLIDVELKKETVLEDQQLKIIETLLRNEGGLIEASPGAGKTIAILGLIARLKQPTLILVHEHRLRSQWQQEISDRLTGSFTLGRYDGDKKEDGDIVVGLINTVYNLYTAGEDIFSKFGTVVVDESHRIPAMMFLNVLNNIPAHYRIGVTGTVKRKDGREVLLYDVIGPLLTSIDANELRHRITSFDYTIVPTDISLPAPTRKVWAEGKRLEKIDYVKLLTTLVDHDKRNLVILDKIVESIENGHLPLILSDRVAHCKYFDEKLQNLGFKTVLLIGATRKKTDWMAVRQDDTLQVVIAQSSIASEGLDFPKLSAIHIVCPSSNLPKLKQKIGRIRRVDAIDKQLPMVYDYVDNLVQLKDPAGRVIYPLLRGAKSRESFYKKLQQEYLKDAV